MVEPHAHQLQAPAPLTLLTLPAQSLRSGHGVSWLAYVGFAEQSRAAEFTHPDDALAFAAQHTLMRCLAASLLGVKPTAAADIPVDRSCTLCSHAPRPAAATHGKPRIEGVNLNMARTQGLAAGVLAPETITVGLDLVAARGSYYDSFDRIALADHEKQVVASLPADRASLARHMLWCAKEAVLKATGYGLVLQPRSVLLSLPLIPAQLDQAHGLTARASLLLPEADQPQNFWVSWQVEDPHYLLAVATSTPHQITQHTVTTPLTVKRALGLAAGTSEN